MKKKQSELKVWILLLLLFLFIFYMFCFFLNVQVRSNVKWYLNSSCGHFHVLTSHMDVSSINHTPESPGGIYKVKPDNNTGRRREGREAGQRRAERRPRHRPPARSVLQHHVNQSAFLPYKTFWHFSMKLAVTASLHVSTPHSDREKRGRDLLLLLDTKVKQ